MNNKKCQGCGSVLQTDYPSEEGFVKSSVYEKSDYCERCFKIIHYGEYSVLDKKIDTDLRKLETSRQAITQEMDSIKTVIKENSDRTFGMFS